MSMRLTLGDLRSSLRIPASMNFCPDDDRLADYVNAFQEKAWQRGRWWGSVQLAKFCITDCCIVLPREIAVVEAALLNNTPVQMGNMWYQFIRPHCSLDSSNSGSSVPCNGYTYNRCGCGCGCAGLTMEDRGTIPSFSQTTGTDKKIRLYPGNAVDVGKTVIIQGKDANGNWVRSTSGGVRIDGEEVTLALPYVDTVTTWGPGAPVGVIKQETQYNVLVYSVDGDGNEINLANYQPSETNPMYRLMNIPNCNSNCGCGSDSSTKTLLAVVSLQHIPVSLDTDWLLFQNISAYKMGVLAELAYENQDIELGDAYFFGRDRPARNARGVIRHAYGNGALPMLEAELRRMSGDLTAANIQYTSLDLAGFV